MEQDGTSHRYRERVTAEQVNLLLRNFRTQFPALLVISPVVATAMWEQVPRGPLLLWVVAYLTSLIERRRFVERYFGSPRQPAEAHRWGMHFALRTAVGGMLIGFAGFWLFSAESLPHRVFLFAYLFVTSAGAPLLYGPFLPVFYLFLPWVMLPLALRVLMTGTLPAYWGAVAVTIYTIVLLQSGRDYANAVRRSFELRFENLDLVDELRAKNSEAERADQAKSRFLAAASHDLRQPLQSLSLLTAILDMRLRDTEDRKVVGRIAASVEAMERLFAALLDISKLDAAVVEPEYRDFALKPLLDRLDKEFAPQAEAKGLRLRVACGDYWTRSDAVLLGRVLQNLVANAIRYTQQGAVMVAVRRRGSGLAVEVRDSGIGIAPDQQEHIFEEFAQVDNPARDRRKGLGLGLAIVKRLVQLLGHRVEVRSALGRGAAFSLQLPRVAPLAEGGQPAVKAAPALRPCHVLVIEDDIDVLESTHALLLAWGCSVSVATGADEALAQLAADRTPDLLIADLRLGAGASGIDAARQVVAASGRRLPVVLVSGDTSPERLREAADSGYALLHKPVGGAQLHALMLELLYEATA